MKKWTYQALIAGVSIVMESLNIERFPSFDEMKSIKKIDIETENGIFEATGETLAAAIKDNGGLKHFAERMGISK